MLKFPFYDVRKKGFGGSQKKSSYYIMCLAYALIRRQGRTKGPNPVSSGSLVLHDTYIYHHYSSLTVRDSMMLAMVRH